jgi:hypothetical protein
MTRVFQNRTQMRPPGTVVPRHLLCFHFVGCVKEVRNLINPQVVNLLGNRVGGTSVQVVPKRINLKLPSTSRRNGISGRSFVYSHLQTPTQETKIVVQRLSDQDSSLRCGLINPNQLMGLNQKRRLGTYTSLFIMKQEREC